MNEKLQYASMLEIPTQTCTITNEPIKKKRTRKKKEVNSEIVKEQLLEKINNEQEDQVELHQDQQIQLSCDDCKNDEYDQSQSILGTASVSEQANKKQAKRKFSVIGAQIVVIAILALTIFLTSAIFPNSGINVFFNNVFKAEQVIEKDERIYSDFTPVIAMGDNRGLAISEGVISFGGKGSIYAPCNGVVSSIIKDEQGKYSIEITHSENFKSLLKGIEYAYVGLNDTVYSNIPVGYLLDDGASMCFYNGDGAVISGYTLVDNSVVWEA